jgi:beta-lactamase superfamily II metal-dependent hydrolase
MLKFRPLLMAAAWLAIALSGAAAAGTSNHFWHPPKPRFVLWQLPNQTHSQIMSLVLRTPHGQIIVIDGGTAGDAPYLKGFLAALGNKVDAWFITHPHYDHFDALTSLLNEGGGPSIAAIYGSLSTLEWVKQRGYGDKTVKPYADFLEALRKANLGISELALGGQMDIDGVRIEVLGVCNPEITVNAINNSSLVLRLSDQTKSVLLTADLGAEGGRKLLNSPYAKRLPSDYVQMAHHGQAGVEESFYQAVRPRYCLWPAPLWLWNNDSGKGTNSGRLKTFETRAWMEKLDIQRHYLMSEGLVRIE